MIPKNARVMLKRVLWVFIPAVLVFAVGVAALDFYFIHRLTHPARTELYGSPKDFQMILQKPMWFEEKWKNSDSTQSVGWLLSRGKPAPAIILSHGYGSEHFGLPTAAFGLAKASVHAFAYQLRAPRVRPAPPSAAGTSEETRLLSPLRVCMRD